MATINLQQISDPAMLKWLWRKGGVRKLKRQQGFADFELAHDPLEFAWFDWDLDRQVGMLARDVEMGRFRCAPPEFVREAKALGLSRPLAYLCIRDQLVYKSVAARAETSLLASMLPWARFGRADGIEEDTIGRDSGWFRAWLQRQNQLWTITAGHDYLVETDIANFFPSVPIQHLLDHLRSSASLADEVVRLLEQILRNCSPSSAYRTSASVGLPQENHDASRVFAHSYLRPVDEEFKVEGNAQGYSRWMDDIVVGTDTYESATAAVSRIQRAMEPLGLYPNTSKTRIMTSAQFLKSYMKDINDYLGEVEGRISQQLFTPADRKEFHRRLARHLRSEQPKSWERVLRRFYTVSRLIDSDRLKGLALQHLRDFPGSAPNILEYLRGYQLTPELVRGLEELSTALEPIYQDVPLLLQEFFATCPTDGRASVRSAAVSMADRTLTRALPNNRRLAAAAALTKAKFGGPAEWAALAKDLQADQGPDDAFRRQLAVLAFGTSTLSVTEIASLSGWSAQESLSSLKYLEALARAETRAIQSALAIIQPVNRSRPPRPTVRPRAAMLIPVLRSTAPTLASSQLSKWKADLTKIRPRFQDKITNRLLG